MLFFGVDHAAFLHLHLFSVFLCLQTAFASGGALDALI